MGAVPGGTALFNKKVRYMKIKIKVPSYTDVMYKDGFGNRGLISTSRLEGLLKEYEEKKAAAAAAGASEEELKKYDIELVDEDDY